jgi:hypothetical protein
MSLCVTERQQTEQWYELSGCLEASELFPKLLAGSNDVLEVEDVIETPHDTDSGRYDGFEQDQCEMEDEVAEFTQTAIAQFHDSALAAAKALLATPGQTLVHRDFEEIEEKVLEEAAMSLGIAIPWFTEATPQTAAPK